MSTRADVLRARHALVEAAGQGDKVLCPVCQRQFTKVQYSQRFCGLGIKDGEIVKSHLCKHTYHKVVNKDPYADTDTKG